MIVKPGVFSRMVAFQPGFRGFYRDSLRDRCNSGLPDLIRYKQKLDCEANMTTKTRPEVFKSKGAVSCF